MLHLTTTKPETETTSKRLNYVFVLQLLDGRFAIGQADKPSIRIAAINSGHNPLIPKSLQVNSIVGIKEQNEKRTYAGVVSTFCERYGTDKVLAV